MTQHLIRILREYTENPNSTEYRGYVITDTGSGYFAVIDPDIEGRDKVIKSDLLSFEDAREYVDKLSISPMNYSSSTSNKLSNKSSKSNKSSDGKPSSEWKSTKASLLKNKNYTGKVYALRAGNNRFRGRNGVVTASSNEFVVYRDKDDATRAANLADYDYEVVQIDVVNGEVISV